MFNTNDDSFKVFTTENTNGEISNDVVNILANSKQALLDFANIRDQQDVDEFNQRYNVNLTIPQEG